MTSDLWADEHHYGRCPRDESPDFGCLCDLIHDAYKDARDELLEDLRLEVEDCRSAHAEQPSITRAEAYFVDGVLAAYYDMLALLKEAAKWE